VGTDAGSVSVFSGAAGAFLYSLGGATAGANFGLTLAGVGDLDGDDRGDFLVGAPNDDSVAVDGGEARLVSGSIGLTLHSWAGGVNDHMGSAVSVAGYLNADRRPDLIVGARDAPFGAGEAYVFLAGAANSELYCTAKVNSQGCTPRIAVSQGQASLSIADSCIVTATNVINRKNGLLFWGLGPRSLPFMGGRLCVDSPLTRTHLQFSGGNGSGVDCSGSFSFHFSHGYMASKSLQAGARIHAQYWFRDPNASFSVGLTDAVAFDVVP
jgi:hypothetical protein